MPIRRIHAELRQGEWDVAFGPPTPLVADKADLIMDLVLTDSMFVAAPDASLQTPLKLTSLASR